MAVPGTPVDRRRRRRRIVVALIVGDWMVLAAVLGLLGYRDLRRGQDEVERARSQLAPAALSDRRAELHLRRAAAAFDRGHGRLAGPVLAPIRVVPLVGRQLRSAIALSGAAERVARVGAQATATAGAALKQPPRTGPERVATVRSLAEASARARSDLRDIPLGPGLVLLPQLSHARAQLHTQLDDARHQLDVASSVAAALQGFLEGPRRYLVLAANNAEMRAGSGMFLSAGVLRVQDGRLELADMQPTGDLVLPGDGVPVGGDVEARWGWAHPGREWRNLAMTPRFDETAALAARMWESHTGEAVDGVIALDVPALRAVLGATGPVATGDGEVGADDVERLLFRDQYIGISYDDTLDATQSARRERLGDIARAAVDVVQAGDVDATDLADALAGAARGRHVLLWSAVPAEERAWTAAAVAGEVTPSSLLVSTLNRGGNKLDQYLDVRNDLRLHTTATGTDVEVQVSLRNRTPKGEPIYVEGPNPDTDVPAGTYRGIVAVSVPGAARDLRFDGEAPLAAFGPDGETNVAATLVDVARGEERVLVLRFRLPRAVGTMRIEPSAREPVAHWTSGSRTWNDDHPQLVSLGR